MTKKPFARPTLLAIQALSMALICWFSVGDATAGETVILSFNKTLGAYPISGLTSDSAGNLYGTTEEGGANNCGVVFELSSASGGKWTETVLYSFEGCDLITLQPRGTLAMDKEGNLYGVVIGYENGGLIFELTKGSNGTWSEDVIHNFASSEGLPNDDLALDSAGNVYGTTAQGFTGFNGEAFELSPQPDGSWKEKILYTFPAPNGVGYPVGGPIFDSKGNLYGGAYYGITGSYGAVYELSPQADGPWTFTLVHNFPDHFGSGISELSSRLTFDSNGNLYGTAHDPGSGLVFQLTPTSSGKWEEITIHSFASGSDGSYPLGSLVFDDRGNLYGTTFDGGLGCSQSFCGVVYRLSPQTNGIWKPTILHQFESAGDGSQPQEGLLLDNAGHLFGTTTHGGGRYGYGTVYEITP